MNEFNFTSEMVYGKKHLNKLDYDNKKYKFIDLIKELYNSELNNLHNLIEEKYELFTVLGQDSNTFFHKKFYDKLNNNWQEIKNEYYKFIKEVILPYLNLDEALVQKFPTFRVQLPNNVAVVMKHFDSDKNHMHPKEKLIL